MVHETCQYRFTIPFQNYRRRTVCEELTDSETWTIIEQDEKKAELTDMRIWRKIMKFSWIGMKKDIGVLNQEEKKGICTVK